MPVFHTRYFGEMEYEPDSAIEFCAGLPGFEQERRFLPVEHPAARPIVFLQSLARPDLCFVTLPVLTIDAQYQLALSAEDLAELEFGGQPEIGAEALCLAIVSVNEGKPATANLLAPLVVNLRTRRGAQAIQEDSAYSHQHPLFPVGESGPAADEGAKPCS